MGKTLAGLTIETAETYAVACNVGCKVVSKTGRPLAAFGTSYGASFCRLVSEKDLLWISAAIPISMAVTKRKSWGILHLLLPVHLGQLDCSHIGAGGCPVLLGGRPCFAARYRRSVA